MATKTSKKNHTEISGNDISWWVMADSVTDIGETETERIAKMIEDGYTQGEICMSYYGKNNRQYETTGWWEIINWKDIACELYNALPSDTDTQKKARKRFDNNWG